jgi:DNA-binding NtrC family response regulator
MVSPMEECRGTFDPFVIICFVNLSKSYRISTVARILIADDEPSLLKMMSLYLGRLGYEVATAGDMSVAAAKFNAAPLDFSAVVLDATMPGGNMNELADSMLRSSPHLCVIAASGYPTDMSGLTAMAPKRVMFLHKPFSPEMLANAVRRMLATQEEGV